jgi:precorrin-2 dehydrogenase/sirohydrochlorin ferrochelatase
MKLEEEFGPEYGLFIEILQAVRRKVLTEGRASAGNRDIFRRLVDSPILDLLVRNDMAGVDATLQNILGLGYSLEALGLDRAREDR